MSHPASTARSRPTDVDDAGSATVWLLLLIPSIMIAAGLVVDGGRALAARQQATGLAGEAARAAVDRMDTGAYRGGGAGTAAPGSAQAAACSWVVVARSDADCRAQAGADGAVQVTVTIDYQPVLLSTVTGTMTATGRGTARPALGVDDEVSTP